jgi:3',5'-cyclic AMP phosphodiesterase CpdA
MRTVAHLSDLHFGAAVPEIVEALADCVRQINPDVVAVSGDLTQRARRGQCRQARAFLDGLPGSHVIVPGNHDVPLYNVLARFADPLGGFRRYITSHRYPRYGDSELVVVGANTTRSFTIKDGGLRAEDVRHLTSVLDDGTPGMVRIVVCHHPFDPPAGRGRWTAPAPDVTAVNTLVARGADIFLTGHLHLTYVGHSATRYQTPGRSAIVVEAGTATSFRGRGEVNSFNLLRIDRDRVLVERLDWDAGASRFAPASREAFVRLPSGWTAQPAWGGAPPHRSATAPD